MEGTLSVHLALSLSTFQTLFAFSLCRVPAFQKTKTKKAHKISHPLAVQRSLILQLTSITRCAGPCSNARRSSGYLNIISARQGINSTRGILWSKLREGTRRLNASYPEHIGPQWTEKVRRIYKVHGFCTRYCNRPIAQENCCVRHRHYDHIRAEYQPLGRPLRDSLS